MLEIVNIFQSFQILVDYVSIQKLNNLIGRLVLCLLGFATELLLNLHRILNINFTKLGAPALPVLSITFWNVPHVVTLLCPFDSVP